MPGWACCDHTAYTLCSWPKNVQTCHLIENAWTELKRKWLAIIPACIIWLAGWIRNNIPRRRSWIPDYPELLIESSWILWDDGYLLQNPESWKMIYPWLGSLLNWNGLHPRRSCHSWGDWNGRIIPSTIVPSFRILIQWVRCISTCWYAAWWIGYPIALGPFNRFLLLLPQTQFLPSMKGGS